MEKRRESEWANRLAREKSPYLLQHALNPVDWHPWGEGAFEKARREDRPIFLSIGYATCHWCHVMAHESFEDEEVARLMNDYFVSIKVDREERPDIDAIYIRVCEMMNNSAGWPLSIIMTPDRKPFFAGTYIPKNTLYGRMGMVDLIPRVDTLWRTERGKLLYSADQVVSALGQISSGAPGGALNPSLIARAYEQLSQGFDRAQGGFGGAPKFPTPHNLLFLLRYWSATGEAHALEMVEKSLGSMRRGGIYDHVGFGFHRYATDQEWLVPHFEKMLYDQAMLAMAFTEAYQATGKDGYGQTAREIFAYLARDMTDSSGGFYSAEDADSEGEEGLYYVWTAGEVAKVLGDGEAKWVGEAFNLEGAGNYLEESTRQNTGRNIFHLKAPLEGPESLARWEAARSRLFQAREGRIHPGKDDKILTDWNGLMIAALAKAARALDAPEYAGLARRAADFILDKMRLENGRLLHRYREGAAGVPAFLDDYAFFIWGLLELYEATFEVKYLKTALELNGLLLTHFWDGDGGGFYFTADDGEALLVRQKQIHDGAIPSGNSVAMMNMIRLARITGEPSLEERAARIGEAFARRVELAPMMQTQLMSALSFALGPSYEVVIAGRTGAEDTRKLLKELGAHYQPNKVVLLRPEEEETPEITGLAPYTGACRPREHRATAYVCVKQACALPTTSAEKMNELLNVRS